MKRKEDFLTTYGLALLAIVLVFGTFVYFKPAIRNDMFENKAVASNTVYINSVRNSTSNRMDKIEDRLYVIEQQEKDGRLLKEKIERFK